MLGSPFTPVDQPVQMPAPKAKKPQADPLEVQYTQWKSGALPTSKMLDSLKDTLDTGITTYAGGETPAVRGRAQIMAVDALNSYKPESGAKIKSWVQTNLQGLSRYRRQLSPLTSPERVQIELAAYNRVRRELRDDLGRNPSEQELQTHLGITPKRFQNLKAYNRPVRAESELTDEEGEPYLPGVKNDSAENAAAGLVYHDLDPQSKRIFDGLNGRGGPAKSIVELSRDLGITPSAVSQRAAKIAEKLEEAAGLV